MARHSLDHPQSFPLDTIYSALGIQGQFEGRTCGRITQEMPAKGGQAKSLCRLFCGAGTEPSSQRYS